MREVAGDCLRATVPSCCQITLIARLTLEELMVMFKNTELRQPACTTTKDETEHLKAPQACLNVLSSLLPLITLLIRLFALLCAR